MGERDWQRIYVTAFGKMDSDQEGEAEAAFRQVRLIHARQGIGFRDVLSRIESAADPSELERLQKRVGEVEKVNASLGRQNVDLHRENVRLRASAVDPSEFERLQNHIGAVEKINADLRRENDRLRAMDNKRSLPQKIASAARAAMREITGLGRQGGLGSFLSDHSFKLAAPIAPVASYLANMSTLSGAFDILCGEYSVGTLAAFAVFICTGSSETERKAERRLTVRLPLAIMFGAAAVALLYYDKQDIDPQKAADRMYAANDLGPRIFRENYRVENETYVYSLSGQIFKWRPQLFGQDGTAAFIEQNCTMYWKSGVDVKREAAPATQPSPPDFLSRPPDFRYGRCVGISQLTYGGK